ncbi:MAG TPA: hypothetical protein VMW56_09315 [Candidatus Margulisiibacteriota bacterium]|nr:hypothetical protein [Candidatus Margulisiibacteriota bacterium]
MNTPLIILLAVAAVGCLCVLLPIAADTFFRLHGPRVVTCPETQAPVEVALDPGFGALTALTGHPKLRIKHCARWEDAQLRHCAQDCLRGIDALAAQEHGLLTRPFASSDLPS